jgi:hypothetical protein
MLPETSSFLQTRNEALFHHADIYSKLAEIKMEAASAAYEGKSYDWTRYHELVEELE